MGGWVGGWGGVGWVGLGLRELILNLTVPYTTKRKDKFRISSEILNLFGPPQISSEFLNLF